MGNEKKKTIVASYLFVLIASVHILDLELVEAVQKDLEVKPKGTIKTLESDDGVMIDCVNMYSQPAFDNPLIKNIQVRPSSYPSGMKPDDSLPGLIQVWHKNGECPKGTIPIRRTTNHDHDHRTPPFCSPHEYAIVHVDGNVYHGSHASINVWNPKTEQKEFSLSQIWVMSKTGAITTRNSIEAGWIVFPQRYGDNQTRFFIYWTRDNYEKTGCYDLSCPGFVQTSQKVAIGSPLKPVSTYKRKTFDISITVFKDKSTGNWWLKLQGTTLGYWPRSIFTSLANNATELLWGGEIVNARSVGNHTTTQMGSGQFSNKGYRKSSLFHNLGVIDSSNIQRTPRSFLMVVTNPACYDLRFGEKQASFYYGGPGYSPNCP